MPILSNKIMSSAGEQFFLTACVCTLSANRLQITFADHMYIDIACKFKITCKIFVNQNLRSMQVSQESKFFQ